VDKSSLKSSATLSAVCINYYRRLNVYSLFAVTYIQLEMWANAQRDGRPTECTWRRLFNAAKFGWRPLLECRAVTLPRCETRWNLQGCPKLANESQPLVGRSSRTDRQTDRITTPKTALAQRRAVKSNLFWWMVTSKNLWLGWLSYIRFLCV